MDAALTMQESILQLQQLFTQRMDAYQGELQAAVPSTTIANLTADFVAFRTFIMSAVRTLQEQIAVLAQQYDSLEMRSRRKILLLHGLPETKTENTAAEVVKAVETQLQVTGFSTKDISRCHRMGRTSTPDRPRPVLFKVREVDIKNKIWLSKKNLKGSGITLSEFLTKSRHDAFMAARQRFGVNRCWTREGFVFVIGTNGVRHRIGSLAELDKIAVADVTTVAAPAAKETSSATSSKSRRIAASSKK